MCTINEEVGEKTITNTNMEDEHNDEEKETWLLQMMMTIYI
jgi:hypothetical protein